MKKAKAQKDLEINSKIKETYQFIHDGITIYIRIDYWRGTISLMDRVHNQASKFTNKKWIFADREVDFMGGWQRVLDAMKAATSHAEKKLNEYQESEFSDRAEEIVRMDKLFKKLVE